MSRSKQLSPLSRAALAFVNSFESAERNYVKFAAVILASIITECEEEGVSVKEAWSAENSATYAEINLVPKTPKYMRLAKLNSMLLGVALKNPALFELYVQGQYPCSLQLAYAKLPKGKGKKAASKKLSVPARLARDYTKAQLKAALKIAESK